MPFSGSEALEQIPANNIQQIEIYNVAPAHLDADGGSGVINIIQKPDTTRFLTGNISLSAGTNHKYNYNHHLATNWKKLSLISDVTLKQEAFGGSIKSNRQDLVEPFDETIPAFADTFSLDGSQNRQNQFLENNIKATYRINNQNKIGVKATHGKQGKLLTGDVDVRLGNLFLENDQKNDTDIDYYQYELTYHAQFSDKQSLDFLALANKYDSKTLNVIDETIFTTDWVEPIGQGLNLENQMLTDKNEYRFRLDYKLIYGGISFLVGAQTLITDQADRQFIMDRFDKAQPFNIVSDVSYSFYRGIYAPYFSARGDFLSSKLNWDVGLRYEISNQEIENKETNESFSQIQNILLPALSIGYDLLDHLQITARYGKRLTRPSGDELSPITTSLQPDLISRGNPDLKNEIIDILELELTSEGDNYSFSLTGFHRYSKDFISPVRRIETLEQSNSESLTVRSNTFENINQVSSTGFEGYFYAKMTDRISFNGSASFFEFKIEDLDFNTRKKWNQNAQLTLLFPLIQKIQGQITQRYRGETILVIEDFDPIYTMDLSLKREFLNKKLQASFILKDVFNTSKYRGTIDIMSENLFPNAVTTSRDQFEFNRESRIAYLSLIYHL